MMKRYSLIMALIVLLGLSRAYAQNTYHFPQVMDGSFKGEGFTTTLFLINGGTATATVQIRLTADDGSPLVINFPDLGKGSDFSIGLPPLSSRVYRSDGANEFIAKGAATITSSLPIYATIFVSQFDAEGELQYETVITAARPSTAFTVPVEILSDTFNTGVALLNPGAEAVALSVDVFTSGGFTIGRVAIILPARGRFERLVSELFPSLPRDFQGSLRIVSAGPVAAVAIRLSTGVVPIRVALPVG